MRRERLRSAATVVGVAMGIAVVVAIHLANESSVSGFEAALNAVSGRTTLEVLSPGVGVSEERLGELDWLREYGRVRSNYPRGSTWYGTDLRTLATDVDQRALYDLFLSAYNGAVHSSSLAWHHPASGTKGRCQRQAARHGDGEVRGFKLPGRAHGRG